MIETIVIAMLIAKIKGYKLKQLFETWEIYPILVIVILYTILNIGVFFENYDFVKYSSLLESIYICSFLGLIFKHKLYFSAIVGSGAIFVGTLLNKIAIAVNDGKMPVFPTFSYITGYVKPNAFKVVDDLHVLGNEACKLIILTDIVDLGYSILSIGDVLIRIFTFIIILNSIKCINEVNYK